MGHGSYQASDWAKLKDSRGINSSSSAAQIFSGNQLQEKYNPKFISVRESRDSDDSPESTPIILAFDVTGSMGYLAEEIAKNSLNKTALELYDKRPVSDPHIMCAAITSPVSEGGLQVTQFEADIRVVEQLLDLKVGFGGNRYSFDSLVWYFAGKHTSIDCYEKRGKKGFLFVIGDEVCGAAHNENLSASEIKRVFNDDIECNALLLKEIYNLAKEKYEIFHIVADRKTSMHSWVDFLPGRVAYISGDNIQYLSEVITSIMQITNGMSKEDAVNQWTAEARPVVEEAIGTIDLPYKKERTVKESIKKAEQTPETHFNEVTEKKQSVEKEEVITEKVDTPAPVAETETPKKKSFFGKLFKK